MSVKQGKKTVITMHNAPTQMDHIAVHVKMVLLEMELSAQVTILKFVSL